MLKLGIKTLLLFSVLFFSVSLTAQNFGEITYSQAVNISGKQRMLSQRMTKIYLQRLSGKTESLNNEYKKSLIEFNENFAILEKNAGGSSDEVKKAIQLEKKQWEAFLQVFLFNKKLGMDTVVATATDLLKICNDLVTQIEAEAKSKKSDANVNKSKVHVVNVSGKQRMLSQRFSLLYIACGTDNTGSSTSVFCEQSNEIFEQLLANCTSLTEDALTTPEILKDLEIVMQLLKSLDQNKLHTNEISISDISSFSNKLTAKYNQITAKYAKL